MMTRETEKLANISREADEAFRAMVVRWEARKRELEEIARKQLEAEMGDEYRRLRNARSLAEAAWRKADEADRVATATEYLPMPEGMILVEWRQDFYNGNNGNGNSYRKTGRKGMFQIARSGDPKPDNVRYERLLPGAHVVRYLTANGNPGKKAVRYVKGLWIPEGQLHPKCKMLPCEVCGKDRPADGVGVKFDPKSVCPNCPKDK